VFRRGRGRSRTLRKRTRCAVSATDHGRSCLCLLQSSAWSPSLTNPLAAHSTRWTTSVQCTDKKLCAFSGLYNVCLAHLRSAWLVECGGTVCGRKKKDSEERGCATRAEAKDPVTGAGGRPGVSSRKHAMHGPARASWLGHRLRFLLAAPRAARPTPHGTHAHMALLLPPFSLHSSLLCTASGPRFDTPHSVLDLGLGDETQC
jgi:hypothetical protein